MAGDIDRQQIATFLDVDLSAAIACKCESLVDT